MEPTDSRPDLDPDEPLDESTENENDSDAEQSTENDPVAEQSTDHRGGLALSRRAALASAVGIGGLGLLGSPAAAKGVKTWNKDRDANGNGLSDLGSLSMEADGTEISSLAGTGLSIDGAGVLNATVSDTRTSVSDNGADTVENVEDVDFRSNLVVTEDDGSVAVDADTWDTDVDASGVSVTDLGALEMIGDPVVASTDGTPLELRLDGERVIRLVPTPARSAGNVLGGHPSNAIGSDVEGATVSGGGFTESGGASRPNEVLGDFGTVAGGRGNTVNENHGTISGGRGHTAGSDFATVAGGLKNAAGGEHATVGGGRRNSADGGHATVGGGGENTIAPGAAYATIGGGGPSDPNLSQPTNNVVYDDYGTVGGGADNQAGNDDSDSTTAEYATVGGGLGNEASARETSVGGGAANKATAEGAAVGGGVGNDATDDGATVGGGDLNTASGSGATVPGGVFNTASGDESFVSGRSAEAADDNTFVWNDASEYHALGAEPGLSSAKDIAGSGVTGSRTFHASAKNGFRFVTGGASSPNVAYIPGNSASWSTTSTRAAKTNIDPVDSQEVLAGVEEMEVATWEYEDEDGEGQGMRHIGPMAEDFHAAVDVGDSDTHINSLNADGVAFAAIQGLSSKLDEKDAQIEELEAENQQLCERLDAVEDRLASLEASEASDRAPRDSSKDH